MYGCLLVNSHTILSTLISGREMLVEQDGLSKDTVLWHWQHVVYDLFLKLSQYFLGVLDVCLC